MGNWKFIRSVCVEKVNSAIMVRSKKSIVGLRPSKLFRGRFYFRNENFSDILQVSWIRKDITPPTILTIGLGTHIADDRFMVEHARHLQNWDLVIKHVRPSDAGLYECQVSTHPATSIFIELRVTGEQYKLVTRETPAVVHLFCLPFIFCKENCRFVLIFYSWFAVFAAVMNCLPFLSMDDLIYDQKRIHMPQRNFCLIKQIINHVKLL